jgi:phage tail-like protein
VDGETHEPLLGTSHFQVLIGREELGFSEVTRLTSATDLEAPPGARRHYYETVVLRRALTGSRELFEWRQRIAAGERDRRSVTIRQLSGPGGRPVNAWRLVRAWPCRWSGPSFDALQTAVAYEEIELAFDDLVWIAERSRPHRTSTKGA